MIQVESVTTLFMGSHQVFFYGIPEDADFIRSLLLKEPDVEVSLPTPSEAKGNLHVSVWGSSSNPLTRERLFELLRGNQHINLTAKF